MEQNKLSDTQGNGVIRAHTQLIAQKKVLTPEGERLVANGVSLTELAANQPELWRPDGEARRIIRDKCVTTAFVDFIVDQLIAETSVFGDFKYHHWGTGVVAENVTDVGMGTAGAEARATGTQVETDHDTYKSVGTLTCDATGKAITEHGLFNAATSVTLMDRTVFAAINVVVGNQIEFTFEISFTAGG